MSQAGANAKSRLEVAGTVRATSTNTFPPSSALPYAA
jgi:hypothetical protein